MNDYDRIRAMGATGPQDRRRKPDWVVRMATILSIVSWAVAVAVWAVLESASPDREFRFITSFLSQVHDAEIHIRDYWSEPLLQTAFILLVVAMLVCIAAFFFNKMRMKRKTDKYKKSIMIIGGVTVLGVVLFLLRFGLPF